MQFSLLFFIAKDSLNYRKGYVSHVKCSLKCLWRQTWHIKHYHHRIHTPVTHRSQSTGRKLENLEWTHAIMQTEHKKRRRITKNECSVWHSRTDWADFCPCGFWGFHKNKRLMIYATLHPTTTVKQHYWKTHPKNAGTVWIVWAELCFTQLNEGMCRLCCFHWNVACIVGQTTGDEQLKSPCFSFPSPLKLIWAKFIFMH